VSDPQAIIPSLTAIQPTRTGIGSVARSDELRAESKTMKDIQKARKRTETERRLRQADRVSRALRNLQLISGRARWTIQDLAAELECSERTIYRDLDVLKLAGVNPEFDKEANCVRIRPDPRFPVMNLSDEELLGQAIATITTQAEGLKIGLGAKAATRKLAEASGEKANQILADAEKLVTVLDLKLADHSRHLNVIRTVQWALLKTKQVTGTYQSPYQDKAVKLRLHPYRLCLVKQAWYLIARPSEEAPPKTYRIARFKNLRMTDATANVPEDFDVKTFFGNAWGVYRGDKAYDVEIAFTKEAAPLVTETTWHHTQEVVKQKDGSVRLTFRVDGLDELVWWVLGWAGRARVVKPPELRQMVVKQLNEAIQLNQE
jgi:predicted DNA-binding transcriptional regulator YafY